MTRIFYVHFCAVRDGTASQKKGFSYMTLASGQTLNNLAIEEFIRIHEELFDGYSVYPVTFTELEEFVDEDQS